MFLIEGIDPQYILQIMTNNNNFKKSQQVV